MLNACLGPNALHLFGLLLRRHLRLTPRAYCLHTTTTTQEEFEAPFLEASADFYREESGDSLARHSASEYLVYAERRIREERERALLLNATTKGKLMEIVHAQLVAAHAVQLLEVRRHGVGVSAAWCLVRGVQRVCAWIIVLVFIPRMRSGYSLSPTFSSIIASLMTPPTDGALRTDLPAQLIGGQRAGLLVDARLGHGDGVRCAARMRD